MKDSHFFKTDRFRISFLLLLAFVGVIYIPLLLKGGIVADDWDDIRHVRSCRSFFECYRSFFPLFSNRPLAPLPITASTMVFGMHFSLYLLLNSAIFFIAIGLIARLVLSLAGFFEAVVFSALAVMPVIAMPVIVSPINQLTATISFLYWAISIQLLHVHAKTSRKSAFYNCYFFLLLSFLTYEVILPLVTFTALLPFIVDRSLFEKRRLRYVIRFILPIIAVLFIATIWQKVIAPHFTVVYSRLNFNPHQAFYSLKSWGGILLKQLPRLFFQAVFRASFLGWCASLLLVAAFWNAWRREIPYQKPISERWAFSVACGLCFFTSPFIFILSGAYAVEGGYDARGLSSTWITLALLAAGIAHLIRNRLFVLILMLFGVFSVLSFTVQRDNYIESWQIQMRIIKDVVGLIEKNRITSDLVILGDVPMYLPNHYNYEIVFYSPTNFGAALILYTDGLVNDGAVIDSRRNLLHNIKVTDKSVWTEDFLIIDAAIIDSRRNLLHDIKVTDKSVLTVDKCMFGDTRWTADITNLWFYDFNPQKQKGILIKVSDSNHLRKMLQISSPERSL
jgi:hypothetical protein